MNTLEKAARALCEVPFELPGAGGLRGTVTIAPAQAKELALAVLKAIREPSEEMLAGAKPEPTHLYGVGNRGDEYQAQMKAAVAVDRAVVRQDWQACIDTILTPSGASQ